MSHEKIYFLIEKYLNNTATDQEKEILLKWYRSEISKEVEWNSESFDEEDQIKEQMYNQIKKHLDHKVKRHINWFRLSAAAVILVIFSISLHFYISRPGEKLIIQKAQLKKIDIEPGGNKAILTLADNSTIILDNAANGILANQSNTRISKTESGKLIYAPEGSPGKNLPVVYNTISTPRGGQFQIKLPDGTQVWLNAESSLRFPAFFTGDYRSVELVGEAYFEVAKNAEMPFKVQLANNTEVEVLGTHFNIMAYRDESSTQTTLLEGSVKIHQGKNNRVIIPGQQAISGRDTESINIKHVDVEGVTAWKNGYFAFKNEDIRSIMRKISRWYNVDVEYQNNISNKVFAGTVSRFETVSEVLEMLELTGSIHFKIIPGDASGKGRRILVMP